MKRYQDEMDGDILFDNLQTVLYALESATMQVYKEHPELLDHHVKRVLEALEKRIKAQSAGRELPAHRLRGLEVTLYDELVSLCDRFLTGGKLYKTPEEDLPEGQDPELKDEDVVMEMPPVSHSELLESFKRLLRSLHTWGTDYGIRGYLNYVKGFFPA
jgi:molybdopterin converting factor small subunit